MTFKEFADWCNERACDGCWGLREAYICTFICTGILEKPFWKREKAWKQISKEVEETIINPTNKIFTELQEKQNDTNSNN